MQNGPKLGCRFLKGNAEGSGVRRFMRWPQWLTWAFAQGIWLPLLVSLTTPDCERRRFVQAYYASAKFKFSIASSISAVFLYPTVTQSTPAFRNANLIAA
jgi:hypothetical protein